MLRLVFHNHVGASCSVHTEWHTVSTPFRQSARARYDSGYKSVLDALQFIADMMKTCTGVHI